MKKLYPNKTIKEFSYLIGNKAIIAEPTKNLNGDKSFSNNAVVFNTDNYDLIISILESDNDIVIEMMKFNIDYFLYRDIFDI